MSGVINKLKYFIGIDDYEDDYEDDYSSYQAYEELAKEEESPVRTKTIKNNVVNLHSNATMKIIVHEPLNYEEAPKIVNDLKMKKTVIVNLEQLDLEVKKEIFNFINGAIYYMEGNIQKVTRDIFILAPSTVEIDGLKNDLKEKGIFSW